jgi:hypothetical protein
LINKIQKLNESHLQIIVNSRNLSK